MFAGKEQEFSKFEECFDKSLRSLHRNCKQERDKLINDLDLIKNEKAVCMENVRQLFHAESTDEHYDKTLDDKNETSSAAKLNPPSHSIKTKDNNEKSSSQCTNLTSSEATDDKGFHLNSRPPSSKDLRQISEQVSKGTPDSNNTGSIRASQPKSRHHKNTSRHSQSNEIEDIRKGVHRTQLVLKPKLHRPPSAIGTTDTSNEVCDLVPLSAIQTVSHIREDYSAAGVQRVGSSLTVPENSGVLDGIMGKIVISNNDIAESKPWK